MAKFKFMSNILNNNRTNSLISLTTRRIFQRMAEITNSISKAEQSIIFWDFDSVHEEVAFCKDCCFSEVFR